MSFFVFTMPSEKLWTQLLRDVMTACESNHVSSVLCVQFFVEALYQLADRLQDIFHSVCDGLFLTQLLRDIMTACESSLVSTVLCVWFFAEALYQLADRHFAFCL
jgi:hypothetical protein